MAMTMPDWVLISVQAWSNGFSHSRLSGHPQPPHPETCSTLLRLSMVCNFWLVTRRPFALTKILLKKMLINICRCCQHSVSWESSIRYKLFNEPFCLHSPTFLPCFHSNKTHQAYKGCLYISCYLGTAVPGEIYQIWKTDNSDMSVLFSIHTHEL